MAGCICEIPTTHIRCHAIFGNCTAKPYGHYLSFGVFGAPFCRILSLERRPPKRVLELACGSDCGRTLFMSTLSEKGHEDTVYRVDILPLAPDLRSKASLAVLNGMIFRTRNCLPRITSFVFIKDAGLCDTAVAGMRAIY